MKKLNRLDTTCSVDVLHTAILCAPSKFREKHGEVSLAQVAISVQNVEMDLFLDELHEMYPSLVSNYEQLYSFTSLKCARVWMFQDGSMIILKDSFEIYQL